MFSFYQTQKLIGVNSKLDDDRHILMWDFDDMKLDDVILSLMETQYKYNLSTIFILNTGRPDSYIAYCFDAHPFQKAAEIICSTRGIDWDFYRLAIIRGYFTLRVSPKSGRKIKLAAILPSTKKPDATVKDLNHWLIYEALTDQSI
jgi:hypothetical protein